MDITLTAKRAEVTGDSYLKVSVELEGVDIDDIIALIPIADFVAYHKNYSTNAVLDEIGIDEVKDYFELVEESNQEDGD